MRSEDALPAPETKLKTKGIYYNFKHQELSTKAVDKVVEKPVFRPQALNI